MIKFTPTDRSNLNEMGDVNKSKHTPSMPEAPKLEGLTKLKHPSKRYYEYKFKRSGNIIQKPTELNYDYATIRKNPYLKDGQGFDDYSGITDRKGSRLIYKFDDDSTISNFNYDLDKGKESKQKERGYKGKSRKGTAFTINNEEVADELFKVVGGSSIDEYLKIGYKDNKGSSEKNIIRTDRNPQQVKLGILGTLLGSEKEIIDVTHSHPFSPQGVFGTKFASDQDKQNYKNTLEHLNKNMPKYNIYHPWSSDKNSLPYTMEYNQEGTILPESMNMRDTKDEYYKTLHKKTGINIQR